jgi:hypothetical protein
VTGLAWTQEVHHLSVTNDTEACAMRYCASLSLDGRVWRLPTRLEAASIVNYSLSPAKNAVFHGPSSPYRDTIWTSSLVSGTYSKVYASYDYWAVDFLSGDIFEALSSSGPATVRCVSGAVTARTPRFAITAGTGLSEAGAAVSDAGTRLTWAKNTAAFKTIEEAQAYCASGGDSLPGSGWRLPSANEAATIAAEQFSSSAPFSNYSPWMWTVSEYDKKTHWLASPQGYVQPESNVLPNQISNGPAARCVR